MKCYEVLDFYFYFNLFWLLLIIAGHHALRYERIVGTGRGVSDEMGGVGGMHDMARRVHRCGET